MVAYLERCESGRIGLPAKELCPERVPGVRIPPAPNKPRDARETSSVYLNKHNKAWGLLRASPFELCFKPQLGAGGFEGFLRLF